MELLRSYIWGCFLSGTACVCLYWMPRDNFQPVSGSQFRVRITGFNLQHCCCSHNGFTAWLACVLSHFSCIQLLVTLWAIAHQIPLSNGFSAKNVRVGYRAFFKGIFLTQGSNSQLFTSTALADGFFTTSAIWKSPGWHPAQGNSILPCHSSLQLPASCTKHFIGKGDSLENITLSCQSSKAFKV